MSAARCQHCPNLADERSFMCEDCAGRADAEVVELREALVAVEGWFRKPRPGEEWPEASARLDEVLKQVHDALYADRGAASGSQGRVR
jgi:broad specificity phosphatase PhoE